MLSWRRALFKLLHCKRRNLYLHALWAVICLSITLDTGTLCIYLVVRIFLYILENPITIYIATTNIQTIGLECIEYCTFFPSGFEEKLYSKVGTLYAMSLVHGSAAPRCFSELMVAKICAQPREPTIFDIVQPHMKQILTKVIIRTL